MKNANSKDKPSPADTPTKKPVDNGHKSVVKKADKVYRAKQPKQADIADRRENEEQPVQPVK